MNKSKLVDFFAVTVLKIFNMDKIAYHRIAFKFVEDICEKLLLTE